MRTMKASEFKAKCLAVMDEVATTGEAVTITKNGKPVVELVPSRTKRVSDPFGMHKGRIKILGDIMSPVGEDEWEVLK
ncbi:MAG: type II toxin-antitoxin system Phd/YefM family antitoxin [Alphaproteobacteria bacterium]|nr:type II toxin-antitoxin system Phd/YefM family antitoxin [Alphaproteobacteria bacterium]